MALVLSEVRRAFITAGVDEVQAEKAAAEIASYENRLAKIETDVTLVKWMLGTNIGLTLLVLGVLLNLLLKLK
jgi:hypothetical protein